VQDAGFLGIVLMKNSRVSLHHTSGAPGANSPQQSACAAAAAAAADTAGGGAAAAAGAEAPAGVTQLSVTGLEVNGAV
jgi:hypothetical protein